MSSVHAVTEEVIFKARVASFYELTSEGRMKLLEEFGKWLKQKGIEQDFLVWRVQIEIEGKKND
jgi:hypothetical protein